MCRGRSEHARDATKAALPTLAARCGVAALVLLGGCDRLGLGVEAGAREEFSKAESCPLSRVTSHVRGDLRRDTEKRETPPVAIAADPPRLRVWKDEQDKANRSARDFDSQHTVIELTGCDRTVIWDCMTHDFSAWCEPHTGAVK